MPNSERNEASEYFKERFGVDIESIEGLKFVQRSGDYWLRSTEENELDKQTEGIRSLRDTGKYLKPTTYVLQLFDEKIEKNVVELDREELKELLNGGMIPVEASSKGYVALSFEGKIIGCGLYMDDVVSSRIPRGRAKELELFI